MTKGLQSVHDRQDRNYVFFENLNKKTHVKIYQAEKAINSTIKQLTTRIDDQNNLIVAQENRINTLKSQFERLSNKTKECDVKMNKIYNLLTTLNSSFIFLNQRVEDNTDDITKHNNSLTLFSTGASLRIDNMQKKITQVNIYMIAIMVVIIIIKKMVCLFTIGSLTYTIKICNF